ncbi:MAG TPA: ATP-binding protein, partial [Terriglobales bacterium]|nr:ATP-binding protein [Terriglobales bacterium]
ELVNHLLAFSRKQARVLEILDLNAIVERTARLLRRTLGERINLVLQCSPELWPVKADDGQMVQVLMNLGLNARDAMPLGGTLTIRTRNLSPDRDPLPSLLAQQTCVCLEVEDQGSGISPEVKERMFEPFFTTKGPGRGTGLGLSTVYGIVKQSGGDIQVESEPGSGARFSIFLPRAEKLPAPILSLQPSSSPAHTGGVILLVEDEQVVRESLARVLTSSGYSVLKASNGVEAEALAARVPRIDFLLTDLVMPRMGGTELARLMSKRHPELRVLFMSGYPDEELDTEEAGRRQTAFIQKPFTTGSLVNKLLDLKAS